ncbi:MAG TPA: flagellar hook-length control protein FliK [Ignavibacteriales bacterium]|nr:flagellar hook-length control protein FliK [Ignavibacteriales bacterium]
MSPSAKAENASSQESKTGDGVKISEKDFAQHILMGDKELKAGGSAQVKNSASNAPVVRTVKVAEVMNEITHFIKEKDSQTVILKIEPENLGKIKINLEISNAALDAKIHVENEQVKAIVESNAKQLTQSLIQNGIQLNSLTVSLSTSDQKLGKQPSFNNKKKGSGARGEDDIEIEKTEARDINKKLGYNTYEYLA